MGVSGSGTSAGSTYVGEGGFESRFGFEITLGVDVGGYESVSTWI